MVPANGFIKISCIFLYRRLFVVNKKSTFDIVTKVSLVVCGLWTIAFFFATVFGCGKHFTYPWGPLGEIMKCDTNTRLDALMISDLLTDIWVWLLPIPMVRSHIYKFEDLAWLSDVPGLDSQHEEIEEAECDWHPLARSHVCLLLPLDEVAYNNLLRSLAAAVVRLLVQEQISTGGYAAHTDVNCTQLLFLPEFYNSRFPSSDSHGPPILEHDRNRCRPNCCMLADPTDPHLPPFSICQIASQHRPILAHLFVTFAHFHSQLSYASRGRW